MQARTKSLIRAECQSFVDQPPDYNRTVFTPAETKNFEPELQFQHVYDCAMGQAFATKCLALFYILMYPYNVKVGKWSWTTAYLQRTAHIVASKTKAN